MHLMGKVSCQGRTNMKTIKTLRSIAVFIIGIASLATTCLRDSALAAPPDQPLIQQSDIVYQGAFRLPKGPFPDTTYDFQYVESGFTYYPAHNSLFINNHIYDQKTAEISIPSQITGGSNLNNLATAAILQNFADITEGNLGNIGPGGTYEVDGLGHEMGGLMVYNNKLVGTSYGMYDGNTGAQATERSHFSHSLTVSQAGTFHGMYPVGTFNPGYVAGYMTPVPQEWQSALGGPALTGLCCVSVTGRTSYGPDIFVFNPDDLGVKTPVPSTPLVYYPQAHPTLGTWEGNQVNLYYNMVTGANRGMAFPTGSRSVLIFGRQGTGVPCYGPRTTDPAMDGQPIPGGGQNYCYDVQYEWTGPHSKSNPDGSSTYKRWVWAYDANDLVTVKNGEKNPWDIKPYAVWELVSPFQGANIQGVGYDPATQRLYVSLTYVDGAQPVIAVYHINLSGTPQPAPRPPTSLRIAH
jgi:hypothetical protein